MNTTKMNTTNKSSAWAQLMFAVGMVVISMATSLAGNTCTWKGGSGKFSDNNWDNAPVSGHGDTLVFDTTDGQSIVVENNIGDDFSIAAIKFTDSTGTKGSVTINGRSIYLSAATSVSTTVWSHGSTSTKTSCGPEVIVNAPIRIKNGTIMFSAKHTFNGCFLIDDAGSVRLNWPVKLDSPYPVLTFNDEIYGPNATLDNISGNGGNGSLVYMKGKVTLKTLNINKGSGGGSTLYLAYDGNEIKTIGGKYATVAFNAGGAVSPTTIISPEEVNWGMLKISLNADIVIDRINQTTFTTTTGDRPTVSASQEHTLTMRASDSASSQMLFGGSMSLVYDPIGESVYTLKTLNSSARRKARCSSVPITIIR